MAKDNSAGETTPDVSFEEALQTLQEIVESLESGSLGLEESLSRFEQGIGLLKTCNDVLEQAEQRIETLTGFDADGNPKTEPLENEATIDKESDAGGQDDDSDDKSLF